MSFKLINQTDRSLSFMMDCFSEFTKGQDSFPPCEIIFKERSENPVPEKTPIRKVNGFSFYHTGNSAADGIVVESSNITAVLREHYTVMDVYLPKEGTYSQRQAAFLMLQAYRFALARAGLFQMHSAVVMHNGCGIAFCGLSGAGKSTQAHLWEEHLAAEPLNLDQPIVLFEGEHVLVSGSPWSGKEDCCRNIAVPLKAIFYVEQAPCNKVTKMSRAEAFSHLLLHNFLLPLSRDIEQKHHAAVERVAMGVPIYRLECTISKEAVDAAYSAAFETE